MGVRVVFPDMGKDPSIQLIEKTITENGIYEAITDGANGYSKVNVNVEGGGSSDYSTATVTTINNTIRTIMGTHIPTVCEENELGEGAPAMLFNEMIIPTGTSTHKVRMYKGLAYCENVVLPDDLTITTSGNSEYEDGNLSITGDCTITIS